MPRAAELVVCLFILSGGASAQVAQPGAKPEDAKPQFEVASIKLGSLGLPGGWIRHEPGGRLRVTNMTLKELVQQAYGVDPFQVSGGPAWVDSARYDINATSEKPSKPREVDVMLQSLLADRFQLTIHRETRELPVYALVLAKKDGKLGPKLTESKEGGCTVYDPANPPRVTADGICGTTKFNPSHGWLTIVRQPFDALTKTLREVLGRAVIDKTGLTGNFDIHLEWAPDESEAARLLAVLPPGVPNPPPSDGPSIFVAVQEQLSLKLESQKGPVEVLVIDRAEKPSEN